VAVTERGLSQGRRTRGKHAGLDLARIVETARSLDPNALTIKAVADELGVDRKAISHHVSDRETLLGLVALDAFEAGFSVVRISARTPWQEACRSYAIGMATSAMAVGVLAEHLHLTELRTTRSLEATEALLEKLVGTGFDDETAVRLLALLTNICAAYARDIGLASRDIERPRRLQLREALDERDSQVFENLARIATSPVDTYDEKQLDLSIDIFIRGAEGLLPHHHA
jgi:TetR/AcrR family transcriptional regulator, tetracycline repressor protein